MTELEKTNVFSISMGNTGVLEEVAGRAEAVARAKQISLDHNRQKVTLQRLDEMVTMVFSDGQLETYVCETRDRKSPGRKKDDFDDEEAEALNEMEDDADDDML
jgi:hypothetical protein